MKIKIVKEKNEEYIQLTAINYSVLILLAMFSFSICYIGFIVMFMFLGGTL